ncbi:unnamed protein product [Nesidiocoris tenuis]|uniref:Menorin-like domain-containing protein n=1 Tax=Nesidiocoris tenuis TaxID=355587 RepID=A0A6H5GI75_9HEMI|nr:unnamed protein product [Nesidiocoris tenuis]
MVIEIPITFLITCNGNGNWNGNCNYISSKEWEFVMGNGIPFLSTLPDGLWEGNGLTSDTDFSRFTLAHVEKLPSSLLSQTDPIINISLPIMAHPPDNTSDISLEEFLNTALEFHDVSKGIKLDFKSTQAFEASIDLLERAFQDRPLYIPIWINADIMGGPGARDRQHVDPNLFLSTCSSKFPMATISVGWTTMFGTTDDRYTPEDIDRMTEILAKNCIIQPVTFAVRAAFAANSRGVLTSLIKGSSDTTTLTIWASSRGDIVDMDELRALISDVGKDRVYLDLLPDVYESFKSATGNVLSKCALVAASTLLAFGSYHLSH